MKDEVIRARVPRLMHDTFISLAREHGLMSGNGLCSDSLYSDSLYSVDLGYIGCRCIDLQNAFPRCTNLCHANLRRANLAGANLSKDDLCNAGLCHTDLSRIVLDGIDLREATRRFLQDDPWPLLPGALLAGKL